MNLKTERLKLRELSLADLEQIHELHSLPETDEFNTMGIPDDIEISKQLLSDWISTQEQLPRTKYVLCIENIENEFLGLIGFNMGKPKYRSAEIWYKLHPKYWNQGFATEAVKRILDFGFSDLQLHRIEAGCAIDNIASRIVLEKVGMIKEGHCRKKLPIRGTWVDNYEFAILATDFYNTKHI